jgi:ParB family chromosome partitioning protein
MVAPSRYKNMNKSIFQNIGLKLITESKTNPRGTSFEGPEFNDLVASIKEKGIIVPLIVRPAGKVYELVAGSRRFRAAQKLKLTEVPVNIQELSDAEAQEVQIIENLQRADVHPLEEGIAYRKMILDMKKAVSDVAIAVGKSEGYVRDRIFLTNLVPAAQKKYRAGEILDGHAVLIAKLSENDQEKALDYATDEWDKPTVADLKKWIEREYYSPMERQPWLKDKSFMVAHKHAKNCQPDSVALFMDYSGVKAGACTDLDCWTAHMEAWIAQRVETGRVRISSNYGRTKGVFDSGQWQSAVGKKSDCKLSVPAIYAGGTEIGKETQVCVDATCKKHWGSSKPSGIRKLTDTEKAERKKQKEEEEAHEAKEEKQLMDAIVRVKYPLSEKHLGALLKVLIDGEAINSEEVDAVIRRMGLKTEEGSWHGPEILEKAAKKMTSTEQLQLIFELLLRDNMYGIDYGKTLKML